MNDQIENETRGTDGRFVAGNPGGPGGSAYAQKVLELKAALIDACTPQDVRDVAIRLIAQAKTGDVASAKLLFDRLFGKAEQQVNLNQPEQDDPRQAVEALKRLMGLKPQG